MSEGGTLSRVLARLSLPSDAITLRQMWERDPSVMLNLRSADAMAIDALAVRALEQEYVCLALTSVGPSSSSDMHRRHEIEALLAEAYADYGLCTGVAGASQILGAIRSRVRELQGAGR